MIKKIGLFVLLFIVIFSVGISFADILPDPTIPEEKCIMFDFVKFENGRVVNVNKDGETIYEEHANECVKYGTFYVLNYDIHIENISKENIKDRAEEIIINRPSWTMIGYYPIRHEYIYKIVVNGSGSYEAKLIGENKIDLRERNPIYIGEDDILVGDFTQFIKSLILTVFVETLLLFFIVKFCRKSGSIKNRKILVTGILASTVTLPLLWFVLPIFISNYWVYVILGEILVTIIETFIIKYSLKVERKMAVFASVICNLCSFIVGLFIF